MTEPVISSGEKSAAKTIVVVACDFERTALGTRSRLGDSLAGKLVLTHVVERLLRVTGLSEIVLLAPAEQTDRLAPFCSDDRVRPMELVSRPAFLSDRVRIGRAWGMRSWRGGAGQWTHFDEEYHPIGVANACKAFDAAHVLVVNSHAALMDVQIVSALIHHHLEKNHEMRVTYTPAAPGIAGLMLRAEIVHEMARAGVMPWQLLAYDPKSPNFDTLIREACMQVDPALSKIPNRFCVDTDRSFAMAEEILAHEPFQSAASMAIFASRSVAPGTLSPLASPFPWEVELELTAERMTDPPDALPRLLRSARGSLDPSHWAAWLERSALPNDVVITIGGDGDPLLYPHLATILRAIRAKKLLSVCVQTDLVGGDVDGLLAACREGLIDVVTVPFYGHTAETYAKVSKADLHATLIANLGRLAEVTRGRDGLPFVIPRLLKVRETIGEMEPFFDTWIQRTGWALMQPPSDRAGELPFAAVVDMAPPKRRACRRLWDRLLIHANGIADACDQDIYERLALGSIESRTVEELWSGQALDVLRNKHREGAWETVTPCATCREWHRT